MRFLTTLLVLALVCLGLCLSAGVSDAQCPGAGFTGGFSAGYAGAGFAPPGNSVVTLSDGRQIQVFSGGNFAFAGNPGTVFPSYLRPRALFLGLGRGGFRTAGGFHGWSQNSPFPRALPPLGRGVPGRHFTFRAQF